MVKSSKTQFYVLLAITLALIAVTLILLFVPEPKPITITEKFYINNDFELHGTIRNDSGSDRTFTYYGQQITVTVHINDFSTGTEYDRDYKIFNEDVTVKAGESYEITKELGLSGEAKITKVTASLHKKDYSVNYTLYGKVINEGTFAIAAAFVGFAGFLFLVATITSLIFSIVIAKRANQIINDIKQRFGGGIYASGCFGDKKQERADATKTAFGVIGAMISMVFLGVGFYNEYGGRRRRNFVITPTALYEVNGKKIEYTNLMPQVQVNFTNAPVIDKGKKLIMNGADGRSYLSFMPEKGDKQKLIEALNALFNTEEN